MMTCRDSQTALPCLTRCPSGPSIKCHVTPDLPRFLVVPYFTSGHDEEHAGAYEGDLRLVAKWLVAVMIDDGRPGNIRELAWICGDHLADLPTLGFASFLFLLQPAGCSKLQHHLPSISYAAPTFDKLRWCCWYGPNSRSSGTC